MRGYRLLPALVRTWQRANAKQRDDDIVLLVTADMGGWVVVAPPRREQRKIATFYVSKELPGVLQSLIDGKAPAAASNQPPRPNENEAALVTGLRALEALNEAWHEATDEPNDDDVVVEVTSSGAGFVCVWPEGPQRPDYRIGTYSEPAELAPLLARLTEEPRKHLKVRKTVDDDDDESASENE
jgi:hypothetical protein